MYIWNHQEHSWETRVRWSGCYDERQGEVGEYKASINGGSRWRGVNCHESCKFVPQFLDPPDIIETTSQMAKCWDECDWYVQHVINTDKTWTNKIETKNLNVNQKL